MEKRLISTGLSTKPNIDEAVEEAYSKALEGLRGKPALILAYASYSQYPDPVKVREALSKVAGGIPYACVSTAGEYVQDGPSTKSLAMVLLSNEAFKATVATGEGAQTTPVSAGAEAARKALESLGTVEYSLKGVHKSPLIALLYSAPGREEEVIRGVREVLGPHIPIIGGSSGDDFRLKPPFGYQVGPDKAGAGLALLVLLVSKLDYVIIGGHACRATGNYGIVSRTSGARSEVVEDIDWKPAVEVYASWIGKDVEYVRKNMLSIGLEYPFGVYDPVMGEIYVKHPAMVIGNGIMCFARIPLYSTIHLLYHSKEDSIMLGGRLAEEAKKSVGDIEGAILVHCAGSSAYIGDEGKKRFVREMANVLNAPFAGHAAYGEQWGYYGYGIWSTHQNLTTAILAFGKRTLF